VADRNADLSAEAARVVLLPDRLDYLAPLLRYSRRVVARIRSSILIFAFGINFVAVGFAAFGLLPPAAAATVHQAASLLVILNCVRLLYEGRAAAPRGERGWRRFRLLAAPVDRLTTGWTAFNTGRRRTVHRLEHALEDSPARLQSLAPRLLRPAPVVVAAVWAASGLRVIAPQEVGLVQRFGRHTGTELGPGLHWRLPWPVDQVKRVEPNRLRTAAVGTPRASATSAGERPSYEWNVRHAGFTEAAPLERLMLTGDENLVEVAARIHYRVADAAAFTFRTTDPATLVEQSAEQSLRTVLAGHPPGDGLTGKRQQIEAAWRRHLGNRLDRLEAGVEVVSATIQDAHPPLDVVDAFREAASALEERETLIDEAEGYALADHRAANQRKAIATLEHSHATANECRLKQDAITATTDARIFGLHYGIPALVYGPRAECIHGANERVNLESVRRVTQTIALFVAAWCGLER